MDAGLTFTDADIAVAGAIGLRRRREIAAKRIPWSKLARAEQLPPPGDWRFWALRAGRGFGKTRSGAEYILDQIEQGRTAHIMLIAATNADVRDVIVEGPSGIVKCAEARGWNVRYESSKRLIQFPNGAVARTRSAEEPDRIRGPECDLAWWDEFGTWKLEDAYTNADLGLRRRGPRGDRARAVVTFTPKPRPIVRKFLKRKDVAVTGGSTFDNAANLDEATLASYLEQYEGTRLGKQELEGILLEDVEGAIWKLADIEATRLKELPKDVKLHYVAVGVDPPESEDGAECGIVVSGRGNDRRGYVLADCSRQGSPAQWGNAVVEAFDAWEADQVIVERNAGGDMVASTLRTIRPNLPIKEVWASRGKRTRAEPIASLYEQLRVSHVGTFGKLESQMTEWIPGEESPDRMDGLVWSLFATVGKNRPPARVR